jgi:hypothetical protein
MPMLEGYETIRGVIAKAIAIAGAHMWRLEEAMEDADWQHWLAKSVLRADLVLADVTDNNPFVMYELGLVHNRDLPIALVVNSANKQVPATVRGTPFLAYDYEDLAGFERSLVALLGDVIQDLKADKPNVIACSETDRYSAYHKHALKLVELLRAESSIAVNPVSQSEFFTRLSVAEHRGDWIPDSRNKRQIARYLLARMIGNSDEVKVMQSVQEWIISNQQSLPDQDCGSS